MPAPIGKKTRPAPKQGAQGVDGPKLTRHQLEVRKVNPETVFEPLPEKLSLADLQRLSGEAPKAQAKPPKFRFAPSPTGKLHIGGARTALMNFLAAKKMGGEFVLRIEDTDTERSKPEHTEAIKEALQWLGIKWDGDIVYQSQRTPLYQAKVNQLLAEGKAYKDGTGAVFFKMPTEGTLTLNDEHKGRITVKAGGEGMQDFVIQRSDGNPTFLLANAVDDGEEGITHIVRGDDHVNNAIKQVPLIKALGYEMPKFWHIPLIHGDDGAKLSKRHGAQGALEFRDMGYPAEALVNHLARLGMSVESSATLSMDDLVKAVNVRFGTGASKIGFEALDSRSKRQIASMTVPQLIETVKQRDPALSKQLGALGLEALARGAKGRVETFDQVVKLGWLLTEEPTRREEQVPLFAPPALKKLVGALWVELQKVPAADWSSDKVNEAITAFNKRERTGFAAYNQSLRWMLTGSPDGFPIGETLALLGPEASLKRIGEAIDPNFKGSVAPQRPAQHALADVQEAAEIVAALNQAPEQAAPPPADAPKYVPKPVFDVVDQVQAVEAVKAAENGDQRPPVFRYAPTPKAEMGVSGARIALLNYLAAKQAGGKLLVRFEDLDAEKAKPEGVHDYLEELKWLGVHWEGEPITQAQRLGVYKAKVDELVQAGKAYVDPQGAVLFRMPPGGELSFTDKVMGLVIAKAGSEEMKDFVIRNPDGTPSPMFASVVDDIDSGVTKVMRAGANMTDALKQQPLFEALGYKPPEFWHLPGIKGDDGKKLNAQTIRQMREAGYPADVVTNHLVRLGLLDVKTNETLPLDELANQLELKFSPEPTKLGLVELEQRKAAP